MYYINRTIEFITDSKPEGIKKKLFKVNLATGKMTEVISVQKVGKLWYAWFYLSKEDYNE